MKKIFLSISSLLINILVFSGEIDLFQGKGLDEAGKPQDFRITYDIPKKQMMIYVISAKFIYVFIYQNRDLITAIDKTSEWDKVANDNKVSSLKKDIAEFKNTRGLFKQGKDWHTIFEIRSSFTFSRVDNKSSLLITANKFVATDNTNLITDYPNLYIPFAVLPEMKKSVGDEVIKAKADEYENEKKKNDRLFN